METLWILVIKSHTQWLSQPLGSQGAT